MVRRSNIERCAMTGPGPELHALLKTAFHLTGEMDMETGFYEDDDVLDTRRLAGKARRDDSDSIMSPTSNGASRRYALAKQLIKFSTIINLLSL